VKLLLDTHIWIWNYVTPEKVTSEVVQAVVSPANQLFLSPVSIWEMTVLLERKRIQITDDFGTWLNRSIQDLSLNEAPITWRVAQELAFTMLAHRDPADRFLVATAKAYDLTLVTADQRLMKVPGLNVLANN
jgi:PIN domain nuclease of toxin-antitoxin system